MDTGPKKKRYKNPRYGANFLSVLTFWWTTRIFRLGFSKDLTENDLFDSLPEHRSDILGSALQKSWDLEIQRCSRDRKRKKPSLYRALMKVFCAEFLVYGFILGGMEFMIRLQQPLFLGLLLRYFKPADANAINTEDSPTYMGRWFHYYDTNQSPISLGEAYFFAFGIVFCSLVNVFTLHPLMLPIMHMGMKIRVAVCSLIYRKALKLSLQSLGESSPGLVVNLMANDVNRFDTGPMFAHFLWIGPVETIIMTIYLYREMGVAAIYGSLVILAVVPFQAYLGILTARYRRTTAAKTDERVRLMNEILKGIEVIKMYTWEHPYQRILDIARRQEISTIRKTSYIRGVIMSFLMFTSRVGIFITILLFALSDRLTAEKVFFVTCYYNIMRQTMTMYFPQAVGQIAELGVGVARVRKFLLQEESVHYRRASGNLETFLRKERLLVKRKQAKRASKTGEKEGAMDSKKDKTSVSDYGQSLLFDDHWSNIDEHGSLGTLSEEDQLPGPSQPDILPIVEMNEEAPSRQPSVFEESSLKNYAVVFEKANCRWVPSAKIDDLIKINLMIPIRKLTTFIGTVGSGKSSLLYMILEELPCSAGSVTVNGTVSYAAQEPWLFAGSVRQNILFGEDFVRARYMEVCKVCALERDISLFPHGDKTIVGERGASLSGGQRARINLARAVYKQADIYLFDDPLSAVDTHVAKHLFEKCIKTYLGDKTVILVTHQLQFLKTVDHIVIMDSGSILAQGSFNDLKAKGLDVVLMAEENLENLDMAKVKSKDEVVGKLQDVVLKISRQSVEAAAKKKSQLDAEKSSIIPMLEAEVQAIGRVECSVYGGYLYAGANKTITIIVSIFFVLAQISASSGDFWVSRWSKLEDSITGAPEEDEEQMWSNFGVTRAGCAIIFASITCCTILIALTRAYLFFSLCMRSSISLHDKMFECVVRSPMRFFNTNSSGRILNRFSKDMGAVDELLPQAMIDSAQLFLNLIAVYIVVLMVELTMVIPTLAILFIFYMMRIIYIRTSSAIKRLEGITRSPVFAHLNASLLGLETIRSFNAEDILIMEFDRHQDLHSSAWYIYIAASRAFGFFLDCVCLLFIACVTVSVLTRSSLAAAAVGLAITQSISLTGVFQWGMRQSAEMENLMTSVERVLEYTKLPQEPALKSPKGAEPPEDWPQEGRIEFKDLELRYAPDAQLVLRRLNLVIEPRYKVGIVGRTGAGKSSIIQALFRLAHLTGAIIIDDIDTGTIGLHELRSKISIIPQEPVLFSGTMRKNLDPFNEFSDEVLLRALEDVELKSAVTKEIGGLYRQITEGGANFSVGQRQLVCLARALLRQNRILIMDEATANVDARTDALIQDTVRTHFVNTTVLTIAHRLNTVMDADRIMVMDAGRLMEYDHPHVLLQKKNGPLSRMVGQTGRQMSKRLHQMAKELQQEEMRSRKQTRT